MSSLLRAPAVCELPPGRWSRHSGAPSVVAKSRQPAAETRERSSVEQPVRAPPPWTRSAKATSHERAAHEKPASRTWRSSCAEPRRAAAGNPWPMMSCCCACSSDSPEAASRWSPLLTCCWSNRSIEGAAMQVGASARAAVDNVNANADLQTLISSGVQSDEVYDSSKERDPCRTRVPYLILAFLQWPQRNRMRAGSISVRLVCKVRVAQY